MSSLVVWEQNNLSPKVWGKKAPPVSAHLGPEADALSELLERSLISKEAAMRAYGFTSTGRTLNSFTVRWEDIA